MRRLIITLMLILLPLPSIAGVPGFMKARMGTMVGQVVVDGQPLKGAIVSFFAKEKGPPPTLRGARRIPESLTRTDNDGNFQIKLLPGDYYIGAMIRPPEDGPGPPRPGEKYFFAMAANSTCKSFNVPTRKLVNVGIVLAAKPENIKVKDVFTVNGRIVDADGAPLQGAVVMAKKSPKIMRPSFISAPTGADGRFTIMLPSNNSFYILARQNVRGARPVPGSMIGTYGIISQDGVASLSNLAANQTAASRGETQNNPESPLPLTGEDGEIIDGIEIIMFTVPDPGAIKASIQGTADSPMHVLGGASNNIFFASNSTVLPEDCRPDLDKLATFTKGKASLKLFITGYTDNIGPSGYNKVLATQRAKAVAAYLVQRGVLSKKILVIGKGAELPVDDNNTPAGRRLNRRVEIKFGL